MSIDIDLKRINKGVMITPEFKEISTKIDELFSNIILKSIDRDEYQKNLDSYQETYKSTVFAVRVDKNLQKNILVLHNKVKYLLDSKGEILETNEESVKKLYNYYTEIKKIVFAKKYINSNLVNLNNQLISLNKLNNSVSILKDIYKVSLEYEENNMLKMKDCCGKHSPLLNIYDNNAKKETINKSLQLLSVVQDIEKCLREQNTEDTESIIRPENDAILQQCLIMIRDIKDNKLKNALKPYLANKMIDIANKAIQCKESNMVIHVEPFTRQTITLFDNISVSCIHMPNPDIKSSPNNILLQKQFEIITHNRFLSILRELKDDSKELLDDLEKVKNDYINDAKIYNEEETIDLARQIENINKYTEIEQKLFNKKDRVKKQDKELYDSLKNNITETKVNNLNDKLENIIENIENLNDLKFVYSEFLKISVDNFNILLNTEYTSTTETLKGIKRKLKSKDQSVVSEGLLEIVYMQNTKKSLKETMEKTSNLIEELKTILTPINIKINTISFNQSSV